MGTLVSYAVFEVFVWFWETIEYFGYQGAEYSIIFILLIPTYYFIIGFFGGFLFSLLIETILSIKEAKRYPKQSPRDLNNAASNETG